MSTPVTVKAQLRLLLNNANETTGNQDTNLTDGVNALVSGYGQGGSGGGSSATYANLLYEKYSMDKNTYPYVVIRYVKSNKGLTFAFTSTIKANTTSWFDIGSSYYHECTLSNDIADINVKTLTNCVIDNVKITDLKTAPALSIGSGDGSYYASNVELELDPFGGKYDLNETVETIPYEGLENGYDVMFYDENNEGLAFYSVKQGGIINSAPVYTCDGWRNADNQVVVFPYTPTEDIILYPLNESLEIKLYKFYGVKKEEYPYLHIKYGSGFKQISIMFGNTRGYSNNTPAIQNGYFAYTNTGVVILSDTSNLVDVVAKCMELLPVATLGSSSSRIDDRSDYYHYVNFDVTVSSATVYRLDQ